MKKSLLIIPLIFMGSFTLASNDISSFPAFPMTIHGNIKIGSSDLEGGTFKVYNSSNQELVSYDVTQKGKYGSDNVSILPLLLNKFDGNLTFKVVYNGKNYVVDSIDDSNRGNGCPSKSSITFVSENCRYDITLKEETSSNSSRGSSGGGGRSSGGSSSKVTTGYSNVDSESSNSSTTDNKTNTDTSSNSNTATKYPTREHIRNYIFSEGNPRDVMENGYTREQNNAYNFARANGITTMSNIINANMNGEVTRIAVAKMLSKYAINVLGREPDTSLHPYFPDVPDSLDQKYDDGVTLAYQLGIMGIGTKNFRPYDTITRAEFGTVLSRLVYRIKDGNDKYYSTHLEKLKKEGIITNDNPTKKEKRGNIMIMLMRTVEK